MSTEHIVVSRREFFIRSAAAGAGFALGLTLPAENLAEAGTLADLVHHARRQLAARRRSAA